MPLHLGLLAPRPHEVLGLAGSDVRAAQLRSSGERRSVNAVLAGRTSGYCSTEMMDVEGGLHRQVGRAPVEVGEGLDGSVGNRPRKAEL